jgi:exopolyphosphatase/guanosine-5'-triphosphate,3'-diphosphate pyrophosphatase
MRVVRLGEGIDRTGEFSQGALARTFAACEEYAALLAARGNPPLRFVATSATRDAGNRADFMAGVRARLGVEPDVIPGAEEAELSFVGAVRGLPQGLLAEPVLVVDIGGGSTEFVLGSELPSHSISVNVGCVRMTERHLRSDPPSAGEVDLVEADLADALAAVASAVPVGDARTLVGVAGSVTTVAAMALELKAYDPAVLHGAVVTRDQVERVTGQLLAMTREQRAALPFMHEGRVDVIAGGAMVLRALMRAFGQQQVIASETDILDGIVYRLAALNS